MKKTTQLRSMLGSSQVEFLMESHNGLSARIAEEAGFRGIWASGLSISASMGVRDSNEASWTQVLEVAEFMSDASSIPILLDADTGYGNFNNARRLVRKLEQRGIAGMCIEEKLFPKTNSFINGEQQPLAPVEEFSGKIRAVKDAQHDPDFCVVARVEALIAGYPLDEALRRAHAYREAGADAILIHSKKPDASEIVAFMAEWGAVAPVAVVPTKYFRTPPETFEEAGVSLVIWGNQLMRSCVSAMQATARRLFRERTLVEIEGSIASVNEVFRLQNTEELEAAEARYLPAETGSIAPLDRPRVQQVGNLEVWPHVAIG
jgi:phosphoenolpyruvate phosphomutase